MGCVGVQDWDTEVAEQQSFHYITRLYLLLCQNYHREPCAASSSCDIIVIPFHKQDTVLSNETKPQSIMSCPFSSSSPG